MNGVRRVAAVGLLGLAGLANAVADEPPLQTVPSLDVGRYMGTWYEIANYPNRFQKQCVGNTTATYRQVDAEHIEVINRCRKDDGEEDAAVGMARPGDAPARLKVRFAPEWLSWLPFVWGNYWIIELPDDYRYAVVGDPSREYLWVLSRKPTLTPEDEAAIMKALPTHGYDPAKLVKTPQTPS